MSDRFGSATRLGLDGLSYEWVDKVTGNIVFDIAPYGGGNLQFLKATITSAQVLALSGTPVTLIAAPGTGLFVQIVDALIYLNYNSAAYAAGSTLQILSGSVAVATTTATLINGSASAVIQPAFPLIGSTGKPGGSNSAITLGVAGANFTTGNSTLDVLLWYSIVTL